MRENEQEYAIKVKLEGADWGDQCGEEFTIDRSPFWYLDEWITQLKGWINVEHARRDPDWGADLRFSVTVEPEEGESE